MLFRSARLHDAAVYHLRRSVSRVFKLPLQRVDGHTPLEAYGIDSVLVTQLTTALEAGFGPLPQTLFFEYQTLDALAGYFEREHADRLHALVGAAAGAAAVSVPAAPPRPVAQREDAALRGGDIAIIGLAGRYPGAPDLEALWRRLRAGDDCVTEVPPERWDVARWFHPDKQASGHIYCKWGGFIDGVDEFDPAFFHISPREAELLDPQERLFLQCAHAALEDAGHTRASLGGEAGRVGVYVGVGLSEYGLFGAELQARGVGVCSSGAPASVANRVSYFFNFHGPSLAVDTMCSSSLTALHLACQALRRGECEAAIAGGVNLNLHANKFIGLAQGR